ncbi:MAG TPA: flagellar biosynthesis protein FlhB [Baekduia sp.]|uniref:flagellar biosynthesis protein FlhB n=1 Tax=Baekduia sp. TaxID=2600305 RepID=UPI002BF459C1|nr:flagellar biosynthesis protein FlhB [Baekduia sp.]HMJ33112.1 flagellar biosynthesis protein FlhB [Baekduia sp.]
MSQSDKTEKATPKKKEEARAKGQVARSTDLNGAVILLAGLFTLGLTGSTIAQRLGDALHDALAAGAGRDPVTVDSVGQLMLSSGNTAVACLAPVVAVCAAAAIVVNVAQVGIKTKNKALKPDVKRLNPVPGIKRIVGKEGLVELVKNLAKIGVVGYVVLSALIPHITDYAAMVGMSPLQFGGSIAVLVKSIAMRAAFAYLFIGVIDLFYQRHKMEKSLRMEKQEVKDESKGQDLPAEVKSAIRQRQREAARARMMADVPTADVIVTNPTHFSVALKYDGVSAAPIVVAKGQDLIALRIRELGADAGVPIVPDPPLARSLHGSVEVGQQIPEELFEAVAQILAYVYRVAGRRRLAA